MAFTAELHLDADANPWRAREFHWAVVQNIDEQSRPQAGLHSGQLHLVLDHLHDPVLDAWMADSYKLRDGKLVVTGADGLRFRTVRFEDAFCVGEGLYFNSTGTGPATTMSVLISARKLTVDGEVDFDNAWPQ